MKRTNGKKPMMKKRKRILIVSLVVILLGVCFSFAWFVYLRQLVTMGNIVAPNALRIGTGQEESIERLYMGEIDTTKKNKDGSYSKDYIFSVIGEPASSYLLQLAHTTNIGFSFSVYEAKAFSEEPETNTYVVYKDEENNTWYYDRVSNTTIMNHNNYINQDSTTKLADTSLTANSYDAGDSYHKMVNPLYMQSDEIVPKLEETVANRLVHYYILRVEWNRSKVTNNKETDIVYITAAGL